LTALAVLIGVGLIVWVLSCGSSPRRHAKAARAPRASAIHVTVARIGELPEALQDAAATAEPTGAAVLLFGGLNAGEASTQEVLRVDPTNGATTSVGTLPTPVHDACAATVAGAEYLFGGGQTSSYDAILHAGAGGSPQQVATLPTPASDVACAVIGRAAYVVGGYTGSEPLRSILAWQPGQPPRVVGQLPKPLRYAAVGAVGGQVLIAGGTSGPAASRDVYAFDPASGGVRLLAELPAPLTHAAGVALGDSLLVIGGRGAVQGSQTTAVLAVSAGGHVAAAGRLPLALSDVSAAPAAGGVVLAGGRGGDGTLSRAIWRVSLGSR
jgi:hypothetical protein